MILRKPGTQDEQKPSTFCTDSITGRKCENKWISTYEIAIAANGLGAQDTQRSEYFDPYLYRKNHGKIFQWILWLGFRSARDSMQFGW